MNGPLQILKKKKTFNCIFFFFFLFFDIKIPEKAVEVSFFNSWSHTTMCYSSLPARLSITRDLCPHKCVDVNLSRLTVASRPVLDNNTSLNEYVILRDSSAAQDNDFVGLFFGSLSTWQHFGFQGLFQGLISIRYSRSQNPLNQLNFQSCLMKLCGSVNDTM